ncbi:MAG TPA: NADPH:quinone oxidoreductase family protein [Acidimicrobiales bacterium]|nr:NADPH:quinone oxidoreductase family protein [Acidimicrobiales bacterium]
MTKSPTTMRAWRLHEYGSPVDVLCLEESEIPEPGPGDLRIRVQAIPLNLNDLERTSGKNMMVRPEFPYSPGMEVMGVVDACGEGTTSVEGRRVVEGQRVVAATRGAFGGYAEYSICPLSGTFPMPSSVPLPDAAALYFPFHLAWLGLVDRAGLAEGQSVLIHAGAGGAGSAAIQLAKHLGARVFATAGTNEKLALCRDLGADVTVNYETADVAQAVLAETGNRGVDIVFDTVGEAVMEASMRCVAYNGHYVMIGFASNKAVADEPLLVPRRIMLGNFHLSGVLMAYGAEETTEMIKTSMGWNFAPSTLGASIMQEVIDLVEQGRLRAVIGESVAFEELPAALERMARRQSMGRAVALVT